MYKNVCNSAARVAGRMIFFGQAKPVDAQMQRWCDVVATQHQNQKQGNNDVIGGDCNTMGDEDVLGMMHIFVTTTLRKRLHHDTT